MTQRESPLTWKIPKWHPDLSRPAQIDLEHLQQFALKLMDKLSNSKAQLTIPEPGLVYLTISLDSDIEAEVYSIRDERNHDGRILAIYLYPGTSNEKEVHADTIEFAVELFEKVTLSGEKNGSELFS